MPAGFTETRETELGASPAPEGQQAQEKITPEQLNSFCQEAGFHPG